MIDLKFYINGNLVEPPQNWESIEVDIDYNNDNPQATVEADNFEFVLNENNVLRQWINDGISGAGTGIYEPPTFKIIMTDGTTSLTIFDGIINLPESQQIDCNRFLCKVKESNSIATISEQAQGITWNLLRYQGNILPTDYIQIPYVLSNVPDYLQAAITSISLFAIQKELAEEVERVNSVIVEASSLSVAGVGGPVAAVLLTTLKLIINVAYFVAVTIALVNLINTLVRNLISEKRYYWAMKLKTLLDKGAAALGYTFDSSLFADPNWANMVLLPEKNDRPDRLLFDYGFPSVQSGLYTYYGLLQAFKQLINGRIVVRNGIIKCEPKSYWDALPTTYTLPDVYLETEPKKLNATEINSNLVVSYSTDSSDDNTLQNYQINKTNYQRITRPVTINNQRNVLITGINQVQLPFALPTRKESLTTFENVLKGVASVADILIGIIQVITGGNQPSLASQINDRKGVLLLSKDMNGVAKLIPWSGTKISDNYRSINNAEVIGQYYANDSFVPSYNNQYYIYEDITIPMSFADVQLLLTNANLNTSSGQTGKFDKIKFIPAQCKAVVSFRVRETFTTNLEDIVII